MDINLIPQNRISHITLYPFVKKINNNKCVKKKHDNKNYEINFSVLTTNSKHTYSSVKINNISKKIQIKFN